ncbi:MAG: hypothetical protein AAGF93_22350 [Cyanobacteria bacterium P01_H01_bin.105]
MLPPPHGKTTCQIARSIGITYGEWGDCSNSCGRLLCIGMGALLLLAIASSSVL